MKKLNVLIVTLGLLMSSVLLADEEVTLWDESAVTTENSPQPASAQEELAQANSGQENSEQQDLNQKDPAQAIQSAIVKLNQLTGVASYSPQMMHFLVDQEIAPLFDFEHIANEVLLVSNIKLSDDGAQFFSKKLKQNIVTTLLSKLAQSRSSSFSFISARPVAGGDIIVKLKASGYSRFAFNIDLSFHKNASDQWQIFDVTLNHDSLINYYQRVVLIKVRRYGVYGMLARI